MGAKAMRWCGRIHCVRVRVRVLSLGTCLAIRREFRYPPKRRKPRATASRQSQPATQSALPRMHEGHPNANNMPRYRPTALSGGHGCGVPALHAVGLELVCLHNFTLCHLALLLGYYSSGFVRLSHRPSVYDLPPRCPCR